MPSKFLERRMKPQPCGGATMDGVAPHLQDYQLMVMQNESEEFWCAGWMSGLEDMMWDGSMRDHGAAILCRELAAITGVWFRWDDEKHDPVAVPLDEWVEGRGSALGGVIERDSNDTPSETLPLGEIVGADDYYTDDGLFRDDPPTPADATRIAYMLHIISRHKSGWKVEVSSDGCFGSGQYQVKILPTCREMDGSWGYGCGPTLEDAMSWAMSNVDELRPFVEGGCYPEGGDDADS